MADSPDRRPSEGRFFSGVGAPASAGGGDGVILEGPGGGAEEVKTATGLADSNKGPGGPRAVLVPG
eukprot:253555-Lingulodinium_polyedra.AAC.1